MSPVLLFLLMNLYRAELAEVAAVVQSCAEKTGQAPGEIRLFLDPQGQLAAVDFGLPFRAPLNEVQSCIRLHLPRVRVGEPGTVAISWPDATKPQPYPPVARPLPPWMELDAQWRCPADASVLARPAAPCVTADGEQVLFPEEVWETDKAHLKVAGLAAIDAVGELLNAVHGITRVEIGNHEGAPREAYGMKLSQRRADTVLRRLEQKGIDARRLEAKGYGRDVPLVDAKVRENWPINVRTELIIRSWAVKHP